MTLAIDLIDISMVTAIKYPFYGTQWHPEKNQFEWTTEENINHSREGVLVTQYVADFFVDQGTAFLKYKIWL